MLAAVGAVWATPEIGDCEYTLRGKHIEITIECRYSSSIEELYYKSLLENLDGFVDGLKQIGKLSRGKIELSILTAIWAWGPGVEMYRHKNGYYCYLNGLHQDVTQDYLTKIIAYFASDNWESFCYDNTKIDNPGVALRIFNRRIDTVTVSHKYDSRKVLDVNGDIGVYFENGSLICKDANKTYGKINWLFPFATGSKTFIIVGNTILVVENETVINKIEVPYEDFNGNNYQCRAEVYRKWVNFYSYSDGYFLSYSIAKNKFYRLSER